MTPRQFGRDFFRTNFRTDDRLMTTQDRAVLFVDILGFASLTEQNVLEFETIRRRQNILTTFEDVFEMPNPLTMHFCGSITL
jgi:hypothetical protein